MTLTPQKKKPIGPKKRTPINKKKPSKMTYRIAPGTAPDSPKCTPTSSQITASPTADYTDISSTTS